MNSPVALTHHSRRTVGISALSLFFVFGALASGLAAAILIVPGTALDVLWHFNPHAHRSFIAMGHWSVLLMSTVFLACMSAAWGLWRCRLWGYWTAAIILSVNLLGDTINSFVLRDWRTLIGLPIAGFMIAYLVSRRRVFDR
jgi:hypothetical protein